LLDKGILKKNNPLIIPSKNKNKNLVLNIILAETGCHHPLRNIIIHINLMIFDREQRCSPRNIKVVVVVLGRESNQNFT